MEWGCSPGRSRRGARSIGVCHLYPAGRGPCHCRCVLEVCPWGRCAPAAGARQEGQLPEGPCTLRGYSIRSGARGPFRILDLLARLYERGRERRPRVHPAGLRGSPRILTLRRAHHPAIVPWHRGRHSGHGRNRLGQDRRVGRRVGERAHPRRGRDGGRVRPERSLLPHHRGRRCAPLFHNRVLGGSGDVAARRPRLRGPYLGLLRRNLVLAGGDHRWAAAYGPYGLQLALPYVQASIISGTILAEPVVAAFLAWFILSERPGLLTIVGGSVVLAGLYFLLKWRSAAGESDP